MTILTKIKLLKSGNKELNFVFSTLLILSIFLVVTSTSKTIWIITSLLLVIPIITKPFYLLYVLLGISLALFLNIIFEEPTLSGNIKGTFIVKKVYSSGFVVKYHGANVFIRSKESVGLWDEVKISGAISQPTNFSSFDYVTYLKTLGVHNMVKFPHLNIILYSEDVRTQALKYFSKGPESYREVAPLMLLGQKTSESKPFYDLSISLSVVHLFVISGFHMSMIFLFLNKLCTKLKIPYGHYLALLVLYIYLFLLNFPLSATRATLLTTFSVLNKNVLKSKFNSLQILCGVMLLMFMYNRYSIYSLSFIFTFTATFVIIYINGLKFKTKRLKWTAITLGVYLLTLPISISVNGFIAIFGILFGIILSPIFVITYTLSFVLFPFKDVLSHVYDLFIQILNWCEMVNIKLDLPSTPLWFTQSLYLIPTTYLIINRKWNLSMDKKTI